MYSLSSFPIWGEVIADRESPVFSQLFDSTFATPQSNTVVAIWAIAFLGERSDDALLDISIGQTSEGKAIASGCHVLSPMSKLQEVVNLAAMSHPVNCDGLFYGIEFIDHSIIANPQLEEAR